MLQAVEKFSLAEVFLPQRKNYNHSTTDWFEIIIPLHHSKYFTENWFPYPQQPEQVCWKSLGFHLPSTQDQTLPTCPREETGTGGAFPAGLSVVLLTYGTTGGSHGWPGACSAPHHSTERHLLQMDRQKVAQCRQRDRADIFFLLAVERRWSEMTSDGIHSPAQHKSCAELCF